MQNVLATYKKVPAGEMDALMTRLCDLVVYGLPRAPVHQGSYIRPTYTVCSLHRVVAATRAVMTMFRSYNKNRIDLVFQLRAA
jgi:hypothetical protein